MKIQELVAQLLKAPQHGEARLETINDQGEQVFTGQIAVNFTAGGVIIYPK